ncbi:NAD-dependent deacylase [Pontivivens insulae]|uniref:NAD-dependent protein deacylase n=1 Tax=Pontivivens insulae TaxID=1639689 RepID=A0A2R8A6S5_9RHOB|nr:NAD-dependent deacylase [Pontivivens insulae]RED17828.1 NAD-dependent deacetylase [Pontivivens insulae]SPF27718.1 NAD-dependent protein deacylase [Pontivivens insulae]
MAEQIVILTGAGISAESGLGTFRDAGGLWTQYPLEDVATPEGFARNAGLVHEFYNMRRRDARAAQPNAAHHAIAKLAAHQQVTLVTQNVDDLHERAGFADPIHMHGELMRALCPTCTQSHAWTGDMQTESACPSCDAPGLRPDIVWFGEIPYHMERIGAALSDCSIFVSIGTSGEVWPAAGFAAEARANGARTIELNLEPSNGPFDEVRTGPATQVVPAFVAEFI